MPSFESQTAVVVGGSSGFGRGVVEALLSRKMRVIAAAHDVTVRLEEAIQRLMREGA